MTKSATGAYLDGAAVLGHSIGLAHRHSSFAHALVAIVHSEVDSSTRASLTLLGWHVEARDVPIPVSQIEGTYLRERIKNNGCCGERELLKLWAYTFTQYHRVVHLDTDSLVLQNMDELFDATGEYHRFGALFTYDWNMARRGKNPPVQGGFLVLKPNLTAFEELNGIVRKGDFRSGSGWGGTGAGSYWGGMTIQGLLAYYYRILHPGEGRELRRCVYNNMVDNPRDVGGWDKGSCRDGGKTCEDCRLSNVSIIKNVVRLHCCANRNKSLAHQQPACLHSVDSTSRYAKNLGSALGGTSAPTARCAENYTPAGSRFGTTWSSARSGSRLRDLTPANLTLVGTWDTVRMVERKAISNCRSTRGSPHCLRHSPTQVGPKF